MSPRGVPHAAASSTTWVELLSTPGKTIDGLDCDEITIGGGDLVRLEINRSLRIGQRLRTGEGFAESFTQMAPRDGVVMIRTEPTATTLLVPRGQVVRAHLGRGSDP